MDSVYGIDYIYKDIINKHEGILIIAGSFAPPVALDKDFNLICSRGYKFAYWGKDGDYLKFRCPHAVGKCNCPNGMHWCSNSNYGYTLKVNFKKNQNTMATL